MEEPSLEQLQTTVAEKFGRCVLVLQQYELQLKRLLTHQELKGTLDTWEADRASRAGDFAKLSLGQLIGEFTSNVVRTTSKAAMESEAESDLQEAPPGSFHYRYNINIEPEHYEELCEDLRSFVQVRNDLVHHFLEQFPASDIAGCHTAIASLDNTLGTAGAKLQQLMDWAKSFDQTRRDFVDLLKTPGLDDFVMYGLVAGQETNWPAATIVWALQDVERKLGVDGWTNLKRAEELIRSHPYKPTPKKYKCSSWRQVLHESKLFLTERRPATNGIGTETWYRSKPGN